MSDLSAEKVVAELRGKLGGISCDAFRGDNLAIFVVSEFDDWAPEDEEPEPETSWKPSAIAKTDQVLDAIRLPQALTLALPPIVSLFIGFFKNTSLVMTIGIFDLLNAAKSAVVEPAWQGFGAEAYLFAGAIYFAFCFAMSRCGLRLEKRLARPS